MISKDLFQASSVFRLPKRFFFVFTDVVEDFLNVNVANDLLNFPSMLFFFASFTMVGQHELFFEV